MTAPLRIVAINHHDAATLTATSTDTGSGPPDPGFPVTNTQNSIRSSVWKSVGDPATSISGTLAAAPVRTANFLGMFLHTMGGGGTGTVRLQLYSDAAWTTQVYDSTALVVDNIFPTEVYDFGISSNDPFFGQWPYWLWFAEQTFRSYKISFAGVPASGYWQASRFWLGKAFEAYADPSFGASLGWVDQSERNRSRGGSLRTRVGPTWRVAQMDLNNIPEYQRAAWLDIMRYCGTGRDFVLSVFPEDGTRLERDHLLNAKFSSLDAIGRQVRRLTKRLQVEEV